MAQQALNNIEPDDWIIINDIDEIPNLNEADFIITNYMRKIGKRQLNLKLILRLLKL